MDNMSHFGIMNALRTGNTAFDLFMAMSLPIALKVLFEVGNDLYECVSKWITAQLELRLNSGYTVRTVAYEEIKSDCASKVDDGDSAPRNHILFKALVLYIANTKSATGFCPALCSANLLAVNEKYDFNSTEYVKKFGATSSHLKLYKIINMPSDNSWTLVDGNRKIQVLLNNVTTMLNENTGNQQRNASSITVTKSIQIRVRGNNSPLVDEFIKEAYKWYIDEMDAAARDTTRYYFTVLTFGTGSSSSFETANNGSGSSNGHAGSAFHSTNNTYGKYALADPGKTFSSLFIPNKERILSVLDGFQNKTGVYKIEGVAHKLGVLLTGPPGTGKTSFIKATAQRLHRHIFFIPLARVKTNKQLMTLFYDFEFSCAISDVAKLSYGDVIFVIEDIDAASKVVLKRKDEEIQSTHQQEQQQQQQQQEVVDRMSNNSTTVLDRIIKSLAFDDNDDPLNLAGLLNILDGVIDTPGRVVIMTSNHPELLDPALIRPGRVDLTLVLDYVKIEQVVEMMRHYFKQDGDDQAMVARVRQCNFERVTAAEIEQIAIGSESCVEFVRIVENRHGKSKQQE